MEEVLRSGFERWLEGRGEQSRWAGCLALVLGGVLLSSSIAAIAQVAPPRNPKKDAASGSKALPAAVPVTPIPAPARLTPAGPVLPPIEPVRPPAVAWDGNLLTIDAENSTLSDVLLAIRSRTGASIEMPGSASAERVAIHIGPAPIREVLSSLLYGTNFNYVIQSSEGDTGGLGKVMLISRDGEASDEVKDEDAQADRKIRLMPGYSAPGKRDFEVAHRRATKPARAENPAAAESTNQDGAPATSDADSNETPTADPQPVASTNPADASAAQPDSTLTATGIAGTDPAANGDNQSPITNMEQGLQKMYDQRRQIQAQQNQGPPKTSPNP